MPDRREEGDQRKRDRHPEERAQTRGHQAKEDATAVDARRDVQEGEEERGRRRQGVRHQPGLRGRV